MQHSNGKDNQIYWLYWAVEFGFIRTRPFTWVTIFRAMSQQFCDLCLKSKRGEISYKQRLTTLNLLPLCYEREITDLVFFFKALHGNIDLDVRTFVSFVNNARTRLSQNPTLTLKTPYCKSSTFQASYFNRIVKIWNYACKILPPTSFASLSSQFKRNIKDTYKHCLDAKFDIDMSCTRTLVPDCCCHNF
jgi:hypothetical protein